MTWLIASAICGILGRLGGIGKPFDTKYRDLGCPLITYGYLLLGWRPGDFMGWVMVFLAFGLTFGALTTYWDDLFGFDNHWFHGFMCGLAAFPLFWAGIAWWLILIRALALAVLMGGWSRIFKDVWIEETGRYFVLCATIPILLLT